MLEEAPDVPATESQRKAELLVLSARSAEALEQVAANSPMPFRTRRQLLSRTFRSRLPKGARPLNIGAPWFVTTGRRQLRRCEGNKGEAADQQSSQRGETNLLPVCGSRRAVSTDGSRSV